MVAVWRSPAPRTLTLNLLLLLLLLLPPTTTTTTTTTQRSGDTLDTAIDLGKVWCHIQTGNTTGYNNNFEAAPTSAFTDLNTACGASNGDTSPDIV